MARFGSDLNRISARKLAIRTYTHVRNRNIPQDEIRVKMNMWLPLYSNSDFFNEHRGGSRVAVIAEWMVGPGECNKCNNVINAFWCKAHPTVRPKLLPALYLSHALFDQQQQ